MNCDKRDIRMGGDFDYSITEDNAVSGAIDLCHEDVAPRSDGGAGGGLCRRLHLLVPPKKHELGTPKERPAVEDACQLRVPASGLFARVHNS
jgi:hypothetical protein